MAASLRDNADLHAIGLTPLSPLDGSSVAPTQPEGLTDNLRLVADALDHSQAVEDEVDDEQAQEKVQEAEVQQELTKKARVHVQMTGFTGFRLFFPSSSLHFLTASLFSGSPQGTE